MEEAGPGGVVGEEIELGVAERTAVVGLIVGVEVFGAVKGAGAVDSLCKEACGALSDAAPSGIVGEEARRALIEATGSSIISELIQAACFDAHEGESVAVGEVGEGRASQDAGLGYVLGEV